MLQAMLKLIWGAKMPSSRSGILVAAKVIAGVACLLFCVLVALPVLLLVVHGDWWFKPFPLALFLGLAATGLCLLLKPRNAFGRLPKN